jgi:hypothetical protein
VPAHERQNHHGDENQDNRDDAEQLCEVAGIRRDRIRTTKHYLRKLSASFERVDVRESAVLGLGRDAALSKRMRPRLLAAKCVALLGIPAMTGADW